MFEMTIAIKNVDTGQVVYTKGARMTLDLLQKMQAAMEGYSQREGIRIPNPAFDEQQPESEANPATVFPTGAQAVTLGIKQFISNEALGVAIRDAASLVEAEKDKLQTEIDTVELI